MVRVHRPSYHCYLFINQVSLQSLVYFPRYGPDIHPLRRKKMVTGDNTVNIQGRVMVLVHSTSSHCNLSITKFHFNPFCTFQDMTQTGNNYEKWLRGDNTVNMQGRLWFLGSALSLIAIYLYTKFDLNGNSSFKVICRTRYRDGRTKRRLYAPPSESITILWNIKDLVGNVKQFPRKFT